MRTHQKHTGGKSIISAHDKQTSLVPSFDLMIRMKRLYVRSTPTAALAKVHKMKAGVQFLLLSVASSAWLPTKMYVDADVMKVQCRSNSGPADVKRCGVR